MRKNKIIIHLGNADALMSKNKEDVSLTGYRLKLKYMHIHIYIHTYTHTQDFHD